MRGFQPISGQHGLRDKRTRMKKLVYLILSLCFLAISCGETDDAADNTLDGCPTNLTCTEIFISLLFTPTNSSNQPITLDSFYTQNLDNGNTYSIINNTVGQSNSYVVVSDSQRSEINKEGTNIRFIGLLGDQIVVQQDFVIGHDCCHVIPISGPFDQ